VPVILVTMVDAIGKSINEVGIFRESGDINEIKELAQSIDREESIHWMDVDVHNVVGLFKKFFKSLPSPLISKEINMEMFRFAEDVQNGKMSKEDFVRNLIAKLQEPNLSTFSYIIKFFKKISDNEKRNHMNIDNIVKCTFQTLNCHPTIIQYSLEHSDIFQHA